MKIDLLLRNARVFNSYYKKFIEADVAILDEKILFVDKKKNQNFTASEIIECHNKYLIPGLIDIHMHIESSMTTPEIFTNEVRKFGTTTIVSEPHEIANVAGMKGIKEFIDSKGKCPIDIFYGIPSSVPSTNEELETTGTILNFDEMKAISEFEDVICVGEVMNYIGVIKDKELEIVKFLEYVNKERKDLVIEGHCPKLTGLDLSKFLYLGINGDHTEHTMEEFVDRFENGMFVELQSKVLTKELIEHIKENNLYEQISFVTDDVMPDDLLKGHLNLVIKKAVDKGMDIHDAIYCATMTPAKRMRLYDRGTIAPGKIADIVLVNDLKSLEVINTFKAGKLIYRLEERNSYLCASYNFSDDLYNSIKLKEIKKEDFIIKVDEVEEVTCRVIEVNSTTTRTKEVTRVLKVKDGMIDIENSDCVLGAVFERYGKNNNIGFALITGDCLKEGAIATTYAHDSHNLLVVGKSIDDMVIAVNNVRNNNGGISLIKNSEVLVNIRLAIGGILSEKPMNILGNEISNLRKYMIEYGYTHFNPIMSLCTITLPVSPELKLTDKGIIDVKNKAVVNLIK